MGSPNPGLKMLEINRKPSPPPCLQNPLNLTYQSPVTGGVRLRNGRGDLLKHVTTRQMEERDMMTVGKFRHGRAESSDKGRSARS